MNFAPRKEFMINSLTKLLEPNEDLYAPFWGAIDKLGGRRLNCQCYIGLTEDFMLIAAMNIFDVSKNIWTARVPLNIKSVEIKQALIPSQIKIAIAFHEGDNMRIRGYKTISKFSVGDIGNQERNIERFIEKISEHAIES